MQAPPLAQSKELVVQSLEDELLIYNLQTNQAICLNQTAALVWQCCDGKSEASEIAQKLERQLGSSVNEELVLFAIDELNEKGLIENGEEISKGFEGLSRREIVRKVGFASLVALPIVSSIVAPKATSAQTPPPPRTCVGDGTLPEGTPNGATCTDALRGCRDNPVAACGNVIIIQNADCCSGTSVPGNCVEFVNPSNNVLSERCQCLCT